VGYSGRKGARHTDHTRRDRLWRRDEIDHERRLRRPGRRRGGIKNPEIMQYDPIKDRLGSIFSARPAMQRLFYRLLDLFFLRSWYVRREIHRIFASFPPGRTIRVLDAGTGFGQY